MKMNEIILILREKISFSMMKIIVYGYILEMERNYEKNIVIIFNGYMYDFQHNGMWSKK